MSELFEQDRSAEREQFRQDSYRQQQELAQIKAKKSRTWLITGIVAGILVLYGGCSYNSLVENREAVRRHWSQVENVMQRRADLIPNLVETVRGVTKQELEVFSRIADARSRLLSPGASPADRVRANAEISTQILALVEKYPELRSNESFNRLMDELAGAENRISTERKRYIETVEAYNVSTSRFPTVLMAGLFGFEKEEDYFKATEGAHKAPQVKF
jgi:LemA protein